MTFITCSLEDGEFPSQGKSGKQDFCDSFLDCVYTFSENGGGVFWFLENLPYTYEADCYFQRFYGFEAVDDKEIMEQGLGKEIVMSQGVSKDSKELVNYLVETIRDGFRGSRCFIS